MGLVTRVTEVTQSRLYSESEHKGPAIYLIVWTNNKCVSPKTVHFPPSSSGQSQTSFALERTTAFLKSF